LVVQQYDGTQLACFSLDVVQQRPADGFSLTHRHLTYCGSWRCSIHQCTGSAIEINGGNSSLKATAVKTKKATTGLLTCFIDMLLQLVLHITSVLATRGLTDCSVAVCAMICC
jgi:hypothetical protein